MVRKAAKLLVVKAIIKNIIAAAKNGKALFFIYFLPSRLSI